MPHLARTSDRSGSGPRFTATTVVVVTWRGAAHITDCLDALAAQERQHNTIVVDNASNDGTATLVARHACRPRVLRLSTNTGYAGGIAAALSVVDTPFIAWLNDDAVPCPRWLAALEDSMLPGIAAVASRLEDTDGKPQSQGVRLTADGHGADQPDRRPAFGFCGGAALMRTDALRAAGGVPADFFCYYEDTDTAWRLRLTGWRVATAHHAIVRHQHGASTTLDSMPFHRWNERNRLLMLLRCAPSGIAVRELTRFIAITASLFLNGALRRPGTSRTTTCPLPAPNFRVGLRCRVLVEVISRLRTTTRQRREIGRCAVVDRGTVWQAWAGR